MLTGVLSVGLVLFGTASLALGQQSDTTRNPLGRAPEAIAAGARTYAQTCQACHAPSGIGDRGPALNTGRFTRGDGDADLFHTIRAGLAGTQMPAFARLTDDETWQLVSYIRSLAPTPGAPAPVRVTVRTRDGRDLRGIRLNEDTFSLQLADDSGAWHFVDKLTSEDYRVDPTSITPARLERAAEEPQNWLMYWGDYQSTHYSGLSQVNTSNVGALRTAWTFPMPGDAVLEATPLVADSVMFTTQPGVVVALDARTGRQLWRFSRPQKVKNPYEINPYNRGVAIVGNQLFMGTLDAALVALDVKTGHLLWETQVADTMAGYSLTSAPLVVKDKVLVGITGGEFGARGFLDAYDRTTGKRLWRW